MGLIAGSIPIVGGLVENIFDQILGSANPGSYDSSGRFVPGDIESRIQKVRGFMAERGLTDSDVVFSELVSWLYIPSGWQSKVTIYLDQVAYDKKNKAYNNPHDYQNPDPSTNDGAGANYKSPDVVLAGVGLGGGWTLFIVAGILFFMLAKK